LVPCLPNIRLGSLQHDPPISWTIPAKDGRFVWMRTGLFPDVR
jgi:hypothetical protein